VVDGFFVSNYVGKDAFTAVNLTFPVIMVIASIGFMIGNG
jgi:Na+-driven multidrug efflux pump